MRGSEKGGEREVKRGRAGEKNERKREEREGGEESEGWRAE